MTNQVTSLTRSVSKEIVKKLFVKFSAVYGNLWSSRAKSEAEWEMCAITWYEALQHFDLFTLKQAAADSFIDYKDFPPTLGQLVSLCMKKSGIPCEIEVINLMVRREFNHPIVKLVYDKIGSWTLTNGKSDEIKSRTKAVYTECLIQFRRNPDESWGMLETHNNTKALPEPEKIPSVQERKVFKERMAEYQRLSEDSKTKLKDQKHPEFPKDKISIGGRNFDKYVFEEYRRYLMSIPETLVLSLSVSYAYARMKFLAELEVAAHLKKCGYNPTPQGQDKEPPRRSGEPQKVYKNWSGD